MLGINTHQVVVKGMPDSGGSFGRVTSKLPSSSSRGKDSKFPLSNSHYLPLDACQLPPSGAHPEAYLTPS